MTREIKRRTRDVQPFPSRFSLDRMVDATYAAADERRAERRWYDEASIAKPVEGAGCRAPNPSHSGGAPKRASRTIELVMADYAPGRRAA